MSAEIVELPSSDIGDLPRGLRAIADGIEAGEYGDAHCLAWVIDGGDGEIITGLLGKTSEAGAVAHYMHALAMRKIESIAR